MLTEVKERPILFSGPMVKAILEGRKTQTRRIVKDLIFDPEHDLPCMIAEDGPLAFPERFYDGSIQCPHGSIGERLWVRETCCSDGWSVHYAADNGHREFGDTRYDDVIKLHHYAGGFSKQVPSIHMPRWASRIDLEIVCIRVERLNEISHHDALQEGLIEWSDPPRVTTLHYGSNRADCWETSAPAAFKRLWSTIHAADGPNGWSANPWVWVVEFRKV